MPSNKDHSEYTYDKYGVTGSDLHKWIDDPVREHGPSHRKYRHSSGTKLPKRFIDKYGGKLARKIHESHIELDKFLDRYKTKKIKVIEYKKILKEVEVIKYVPEKRRVISLESFEDEAIKLMREIKETRKINPNYKRTNIPDNFYATAAQLMREIKMKRRV